MQGRAYLELARVIFSGGTEVHWRGAAGRAYYALMLECRDALFRWGFTLPPRENVHNFVRQRFSYPNHPDLKVIGLTVDWLGQLRNKADYDLSALPAFASPKRADQAIHEADKALALLDAIEGDPARLAAAIAAIKVAFP
jgi:hypothetical protein